MREYWIKSDTEVEMFIVVAMHVADAIKQAQVTVPVWFHESITVNDEDGVAVREVAPGVHAHVFSSTGDAYDACQCYDWIERGDILLIPREDIIGIADTWPFSVSATSGDLHTPVGGWLENPVLDHSIDDPFDFKPSITLAMSKPVADLLVRLS